MNLARSACRVFIASVPISHALGLTEAVHLSLFSVPVIYGFATMLATFRRHPNRLSVRALATMVPVLPPASRPVGWKAAAPPPLPGSHTFASQQSLPKLPIPLLEQTLSKLKESLTPLAHSADELAASMKKVDAFGESVGKDLHQRLLQHASEKDHWLEQWWDDGGYMGYRDSVRSPSHRV